MKNLISNMSILSASFLALFALAEILFQKFNVRSEWTRKVVHLGTGLLTLLFPLMLTHHLQVFFLCSVFGVILIFIKRFKLLGSINGVDRKTQGSILFPAAVYLCFLAQAFYGELMFFYLPMLILAISDPIAAIIGRKLPKGKFSLFGSTKTISGSMGFLGSAFLISFSLLQFKFGLQTADNLKLGLGIAAIATAAEATFTKGFDNISIPLAVLLAMQLIPNPVIC